MEPIPVQDSFFVEKKLKNTNKVKKKGKTKKVKKVKKVKTPKPLELTPNQLNAYGRHQMRALPPLPKLDIQEEIENKTLKPVQISSPIVSTKIIHDSIVNGQIHSEIEIFQHNESLPTTTANSSPTNNHSMNTKAENTFKPGQLIQTFGRSPKPFQIDSPIETPGEHSECIYINFKILFNLFI